MKIKEFLFLIAVKEPLRRSHFLSRAILFLQSLKISEFTFECGKIDIKKINLKYGKFQDKDDYQGIST
jgi:hypothetical protein